MKDLVILVADKNMEHVIRGILARPKALRIHPISFDIHVHPDRDPGCFCRGVAFLDSYANQYAHILLMMDREGSGQEHLLSKSQMEERLEKEFQKKDWGNRSAAIVLEPEIDIWMWNNSSHLDDILGWSGRTPNLHRWLLDNNWLEGSSIKPKRPKEALESALREVRQPRSSSLYETMASKVSLADCADPAFLKLKTKLQRWFPLSNRHR